MGRPPSWIWYDVTADHPQLVFDGPNILLKLHVDHVYTFQDTVIFIFGPFGLETFCKVHHGGQKFWDQPNSIKTVFLASYYCYFFPSAKVAVIFFAASYKRTLKWFIDFWQPRSRIVKRNSGYRIMLCMLILCKLL